MLVKLHLPTICLVILFPFLEINSSAQKNLFLLNTSTDRLYVIEKGKSERFRITGYEHSLKLKLMDVTDTGIVLKGYFSNADNEEMKQLFFPLKDITSINKTSTGQTITEVFGGYFILIGTAALGRSIRENPSERNSNVTSLVFFSAIGTIPFLFPKSDIPLGDKYQLVIR